MVPSRIVPEAGTVIATLAGTTLVTVRSMYPISVPAVSVILTSPGESVEAIPFSSTVMTAALEEDQARVSLATCTGICG
ncbi:hypothetical protein SDC9_190968 [bioreactor metagenome]|uniref:Uncharacterized protein n=1 Tax=bioreactor metagenome TaxID=1076179 RepID=A0A645HWK9_9ZZZZ